MEVTKVRPFEFSSLLLILQYLGGIFNSLFSFIEPKDKEQETPLVRFQVHRLFEEEETIRLIPEQYRRRFLERATRSDKAYLEASYGESVELRRFRHLREIGAPSDCVSRDVLNSGYHQSLTAVSWREVQLVRVIVEVKS